MWIFHERVLSLPLSLFLSLSLSLSLSLFLSFSLRHHFAVASYDKSFLAKTPSRQIS